MPQRQPPPGWRASRDGPAPIVGVGERGARSCFRRQPGRRPRLAVKAGVAVTIGLVAVTIGLATAGAAAQSGAPAEVPPPVASAPASGSTALTLRSQTATVAPGQPFDLQLVPASGSPPVTQLGVSVSVYGCLSSVSGFDQSVASSGPSGTPISSTRSPMALAGLPAVGGGGFDLSMPVAVDQPAAPPGGGFTIDLTSTGGQCQLFPLGVYPVRVQLVNMVSGQVVGGLTTHLVYADPPAGTQKLRLAVVLPLADRTDAIDVADAGRAAVRPLGCHATAVGPGRGGGDRDGRGRGQSQLLVGRGHPRGQPPDHPGAGRLGPLVGRSTTRLIGCHPGHPPVRVRRPTPR